MTASSKPDIVPGLVVLFGSGETSPSGRKVFNAILKNLPPTPRLALLETPAGFELNSAKVIGRVADFIAHRLQNFAPRITIIPARKRGSPYSPDLEDVVAPILEADLIFMGPGSPSYAVRQLKDSLGWDYLLARHRLGAAIVLASSAVIAISAFALPVYEIFKVGEDLHWKKGLDFFGQFGKPMVFIPHWNNRDGGDELDTSCCFIGRSRFELLMKILPVDATVVGIDENTALVIDIHSGQCNVMGLGGITIIHGRHRHDQLDSNLESIGFTGSLHQPSEHVHVYHEGEPFSLDDCCPLDLHSTRQTLTPSAWSQALNVMKRLEIEGKVSDSMADYLSETEKLPADIELLLVQREDARRRKDWMAADALRDQLAAIGLKVIDTPDGPRLIRE